MPGQGWGMTETSATCATHSGEEYLNRPASCGPALPVSRLKIMKDGVEQPPGTAGELWAFGPNIVKGYWNRPEATAEVFQDGWLKTGDLAMLDSEGFCTILDRGEDMLIRGGENIYCIEVENVLVQHPAVADAALIGLPHPILGEVPAALVQTRPGAEVSEGELREFAAARLAAFKVPARLRIRPDVLPRNRAGKLLKARCAGCSAHESFVTHRITIPDSELEESFIRSSGPGARTSTRCPARCSCASMCAIPSA